MKYKQKQFSILALILIAIAVLAVIQNLHLAREIEMITYGEFKPLAKKCPVTDLVRGADAASRASIIPRNVAALGYTQQWPTEDRRFISHSEPLAPRDGSREACRSRCGFSRCLISGLDAP